MSINHLTVLGNLKLRLWANGDDFTIFDCHQPVGDRPGTRTIYHGSIVMMDRTATERAALGLFPAPALSGRCGLRKSRAAVEQAALESYTPQHRLFQAGAAIRNHGAVMLSHVSTLAAES